MKKRPELEFRSFCILFSQQVSVSENLLQKVEFQSLEVLVTEHLSEVERFLVEHMYILLLECLPEKRISYLHDLQNILQPNHHRLYIQLP